MTYFSLMNCLIPRMFLSSYLFCLNAILDKRVMH